MSAAARAPLASALYLGEFIGELNDGASFLDRLVPEHLAAVRALGRVVGFARGETVFLQGAPHELVERLPQFAICLIDGLDAA